MKIVKITLSEDEIVESSPSAICIGFFDGLHRMHEKIIKKTAKIAKKNNLTFSVVTFDRKVRDFLENKDTSIQKKEAKYDRIKELFAPELVYEIEVKREILMHSGIYFMSYLQRVLKVKKIVVGSDFRFGTNAESNVLDLINFFGKNNITVVDRLEFFSTSHLKTALKESNLKLAKKITRNIKFD